MGIESSFLHGLPPDLDSSISEVESQKTDPRNPFLVDFAPL